MKPYTIALKLKNSGYPIVIGYDFFKDIPQYLRKLSLAPTVPSGLGKDAVVISHALIERLHGARLSVALSKAGYTAKFFNVPQGEKSKSASCALKVIEKISAYDVNRKIFIIALGGGVIGDLSGFVAAIYKRGIPYIQIPTTLLAQIDSAIGGKTAIDLKYGKNLVGAFYQPKAVFADTKVLATLTPRQIRNGLAEAIKYGVIRDPVLFGFLEKKHASILQNDHQSITFVVKRCARIKADVVASDERETKGIRTILNFGHTAGHAIEAASNFRYHHGEAVALGMRVAARISALKGMLNAKDEARLNNLITSIGLPEKIQNTSLSKIMALMRHDKKFVAGRNRFVLACGIGEVKVVEGVPTKIITQAIQSIF